MTEEERIKLLEAAVQASTSFNILHWRFAVVDDPKLHKEIRALETIKLRSPMTASSSS